MGALPTSWSERLRDPGTRWRCIVGAVVAAILVACTVAFAVGTGEKGESLAEPRADGEYYYAYLPSIWLDGDLDFRNEYKITRNWYRFGDTRLGRPSNVFGVGPAVFASPFFLVGRAVAKLAGARNDGFSGPERALAAWASVLASVVSILFAYRLAARRLACKPIALIAAVAVFAGGPVVYYATRQTGYAHPFATLFAAWLVDAWDASYVKGRSLRTWCALGALLGCAVLARPQLATWGILLVVAGATDLLRARGRRAVLRVMGHLAAAAALSAAVVLPQVLAWDAIYGELWLVPQGDQFMRWDAPAWSEVLFSSRNGLFPWSPLYALAAVGLVWGVASQPRLFGLLIVGVLLQALVNGAVWDWWAGGSFGGRRFDSAYIAFAAGLACLFARTWRLTRRPRTPVVRRVTMAGAGAVGLLSALLVMANVVLTAQSTPRSARIQGGTPASQVLRKRLGWLGVPAGWVSSLANLPARAAFALRHDVGLEAYDHVVGPHRLGETYPGLNSKPPPTHDRVEIGKLGRWHRSGFRNHPSPGAAALVTGRGRVFIGLNRKGAVRVTVQASGAGALQVSWNGRVTATTTLAADGGALTFTATPRRGVNELELDAPAGTVVHHVDLDADSPI